MTTTNDFSTREQNLARLKVAVHSPLDYNNYNSTNVIDHTNCYSHAIGSTLTCLELYRIGAICSKKSIDQEYFSIEEIVDLLFEDLKVLDLKIEPSFFGDIMNSNQYQIALFVKIYADHKIHDFHFFRNDNYGWSEKWRTYKPIMMDSFKMLDYFPWKFVGIFKITK